MSTYIRKPVKVEAFKWTGGPDQLEDPDWIVDRIKEGSIEIGPAGHRGKKYIQQIPEEEVVLTFKHKGFSGRYICRQGMWIIKGEDGICTIVSDEVFLSLYVEYQDED